MVREKHPYRLLSICLRKGKNGMKRAVIAIAAISVWLISCGDEEMSERDEKKNEKAEIQPETPLQSNEDNFADVPEYEAIMKELPPSEYTFRVTRDRTHERTMLVSNEEGRRYKSVFVKETGRLKMIQFDGGLIYNEITE